jgi:hypothetical protein
MKQREVDPFAYEILQEKAANLARLGTKLNEALAALRAFDAQQGREADIEERGEQRQALVDAAGEALWYYVVQREVCGLRDAEPLLRQLDVPREVRRRMGYFPPAKRV